MTEKEQETLEFHRRLAQDALQATRELNVTMTFGELFLFQMLLQDCSLLYLSKEQFLELMERNAARIRQTEEVVDETESG